MRKMFFPIAAIAIIMTTSCNNSPKADQATTSDAVEHQGTDVATTMTIDLSKSSIEWVGSKPIGSRHNGTIALKKGGLVLDNSELTGGYFIMDMKSITPLDQNEEDNAKLQMHLISDDFFSSEQYPEGTFEITSVAHLADAQHLENKDATHTITGNLTLKGITKSIAFPAAVQIRDDKVIADAHFNIIRTDWNVNFASDDSIKDKFINKEINLKIHLEAIK